MCSIQMKATDRARRAKVGACSACVGLLILAASVAAEPENNVSGDGAGGWVPLASSSLGVSGPFTIGSIHIFNEPIFDLDDPAENKAVFRLANRLHVRTRPEVIAQQLLFSEGDVLSTSDLEESERILRGNRYIHDASIETVQREDGKVDVNVRTSDVWTLMPRLSLSRSGGVNKGVLGVKETNLLGTGTSIEAMLSSNVDRDSLRLGYSDTNVGNSWYGVTALASRNSDGHTWLFEAGKPFYSFDTRSANGISFADIDQVDPLYDGGEVQARYRHQAKTYEAFAGWSAGRRSNWTKRYRAGVAYDEHRFSAVENDDSPLSIVPENRRFLYPFVGIDLVEDRFEKTRNLEQIAQTEDHFMGTRLAARIGYAAAALGSDRPAWIFGAKAQTGFGSTADRAFIVSTSVSGRHERSDWQNLLFEAGATYTNRSSDYRLFIATLSLAYGHNLDLDNQIQLGGENGLRGYPLRYQSGQKSALLTLERRYFTDWYPFRLFHVGGAVFFDVGRVWDNQIGTDLNQGTLKDIGFGLRLSSARSGLGRMLHIDLAFPLDGQDSVSDVQLLFGTKASF